MKWIYTIVLLFICQSIHAQVKPGSLSNGIIPEVIPPSPEASSLGKYGDWPVSAYTGLPNINIPIYTINVSGYQLPVSLSYHAGGVKIDEVSSWVGTNWSLSAGGVIGRTIVGLNDERVGGGFLYRNQRNNFLKSSYDLTNYDDYIFLRNISDGTMDTEPDLFFFNFASFSGKFYFDKTGNFQCIPANNLKLLVNPLNTLINPTDQHWEIADPSGNVYWFGSYLDGGNGFEATMLYNGSPSVSNMKTTGWYLTKIILANKADTIYFDYSDKSEHYDLPLPQSYKILTNDYPTYTPAGGPGTSWDDLLKLNQTVIDPTSVTTTSSSGKAVLSKIRWRSGSLVFAANSSRQDLSGKLLDLIQLYNRRGDKLKEFQLKYAAVNQRHYLDTLIERDASSATQLKHSFEYINRTYLPVKGSYAQDHWGFFNGATANVSLLPPDPSFNTTALNANREPDENFMQFGALKKITYPTGGSTQFEYEAHRYDPASPVGGGNPTSQVVSANITVKASDPQLGGYLRSQTFNIPFTQNTPTIAIQFNNYDKPPSKELSRLPLVRIEKLVNGTYQPYYYWDAYDNFPVGNATPNANGLVDYNINESLNFSPGDYRIVTDVVCGVANCGTPVVNPSATAHLVYSTYSAVNTSPIAGGLRIKQITNYSNGIFVAAKKYSYAPGKLLIYPRYVHQYGEEIYRQTSCFTDPLCGDICGTLYVKYKEITSSSQSILGFTQGSPVGYTDVTEQDIDAAGTDKGFTSYSFTFTPDVLNAFVFDRYYWPGGSILNPSTPLNSYEYKRGLPLYTNVFKKRTDGSYIRIKSITNSYEFNDNDSTRRFNTMTGMRVKKMRTVNYPCGTYYNGLIFPSTSNTDLPVDFAYAYYNLITGWVQKTATTEVVYDDNGNNPLSSTTSYTYGNNSHLLVTGTDTYDSKGNLISVKNKYPDDFSGVTAADNTSAGIKLLQQRSIQDKVIESSTYLTNGINQPVLRSSTFSVYNPLVPFLDKVIAIENQAPMTDFTAATVQGGAIVADSRYKIQAYFDSHDRYGNLLQAHKANDIYQTYMWDYDSAYPVAKIVNAGINEIAYTSFETSANGNWTVPSMARDSIHNAVTGQKSYYLNNGNITKTGLSSSVTYVVSYWSGNNSNAYAIPGTLSGFPVKGKTITINGTSWTYYMHKITGQTSVTISGSGSIDELRLYPAQAQMTTYTYQPLVGMTSACDIGNRITYYEYDGFQRLKRIRDQDYNIIKSIDYQYQGNSGCGANCYILTMQTLAGTNTLGYPVGVFNLRGKLLGNAAGPSQYVTLWNNDTADSRIGALSAGGDSLHFNCTLNAGQALPAAVTGCRYYQYDFSGNVIDGVSGSNGVYVDFGDGSSMPIPAGYATLSHSYSNTSTKTIAVYHNEEASGSPILSMSTGTVPYLKNFRGNIQQNIKYLSFYMYQDSSVQTTGQIYNWNSISSILGFGVAGYGNILPNHNLNFSQDFLKQNKNLQELKFYGTPWNYYQKGYVDSTFKISRVRSDWNTYFTNLRSLLISDEQWSHEDLSPLVNLTYFWLVADNQKHSNDLNNNPPIPIGISVIDNAINQIAAGAGKNVRNGSILIFSGGSNRSAASDNAVATLNAMGWSVVVDSGN
ncbi:MAG: hypothetical protein J0H07_13515 [Sphingobacteriales bacterium]|nr:hypothetical protein [Sphingobacteriales bacterium]